MDGMDHEGMPQDGGQPSSGAMEGPAMPDQPQASTAPPVGAASRPRPDGASRAKRGVDAAPATVPAPGRHREHRDATSAAEPGPADCHGPCRALAMTAGEGAALARTAGVGVPAADGAEARA